MAKQTAPVMDDGFLTHWKCSLGNPYCLRTYNGSNVILKVFATIFSALGIQQLYTSAFYQQTNFKAKSHNRTIAIRVWNYFTEHQRDWYSYI